MKLRVRILRNVGTLTVSEIATGGVVLPQNLLEGNTVDMDESAAQQLFSRGLAEPLVAAKPAPAAPAAPEKPKP